MQSNIKLYDYGDFWEIEITAPSDNGDYAKDVNYALKANSISVLKETSTMI